MSGCQAVHARLTCAWAMAACARAAAMSGPCLAVSCSASRRVTCRRCGPISTRGGGAIASGGGGFCCWADAAKELPAATAARSSATFRVPFIRLPAYDRRRDRVGSGGKVETLLPADAPEEPCKGELLHAGEDHRHHQ